MAKKNAEQKTVIVYKPIKDLIPYEKNPRQNDASVPFVANSIKEFGFKVPCVIDKNNIVVAGHTRLKAAKQLGLKEVPCIVADDLTDEQVKAFRLADNSVGMYSGWDVELLIDELADIGEFENIDFEMADFGFTFNESGELDVKIVEREIDEKYHNVQKMRFPGVGEYDIPALEPFPVEAYEDCEFVSFNEFMRTVTKENRENLGLHFYTQDNVFSGMWDNIDDYVNRLLAHKYVITPDFSVHAYFPKSLRIYNYYRNMWVGAYLQSLGGRVIPNFRATHGGNEFMIDGMPKGGVVAFSSYGNMNGPDNRARMLDRYEMLREHIEPKLILWFGGFPDELKGELSDSSVQIIRKKFFTEWYLSKERYKEKHKND